MRKKNLKLLDSHAALKFLKKEDNYEKIKSDFYHAAEKELSLIMSEVNVGEVYYILLRTQKAHMAEQIFLAFQQLPFTMVPADFSLILEASRVKSQFSIAYADCFAVATAKKYDASIITGDPEFEKVQGMVRIEWV